MWLHLRVNSLRARRCNELMWLHSGVGLGADRQQTHKIQPHSHYAWLVALLQDRGSKYTITHQNRIALFMVP